jgi:hypothetical protein
MTFFEFNKLNEIEKCRALWQHGVFLDERFDIKYKYRLYQIGSFYIEEQWDNRINQRISISCSKYMSVLDPYLENIEIAFLL